MRIIKHGCIIYNFKCNCCGCEFEMSNRELQEEQQTLVFIALHKCPDCGEPVSGEKINNEK